MPRISVYESDPFQFCFDLEPGTTGAAQRRVTPEEVERLKAFQAHAKEIQQLLSEIAQRPEVEFEEAWHEDNETMADADSYQDHVYCPVCRECITCNLRPCRGGGPHTEPSN